MDKALRDLRAAANNLVKVAKALHVPLDTSTFERALFNVEAQASKPKSDAPPAPPAPKP